MEKKFVFILLSLLFAVFLSSFVLAQASKMEVSTTKEVFAPGEEITFKIALYDESNNLIEGNIDVVIEDVEKRAKIEKTVASNSLINLYLGENVPGGYWKINAVYDDLRANTLFIIETSELAKFELNGDMLTITNIGNTRYTQTIQIIIGDTVGTKEADLYPGEQVSFRLIAPDGLYNIKVSDGTSTLMRDSVSLSGQVIGIIDESITDRLPFTGGVRPEADSEQGEWWFYNSIRNNTLVYVFIAVVIGAALLLAIEKVMKKRLKV